jgi:low temperature requirement protein LtrA
MAGASPDEGSGMRIALSREGGAEREVSPLELFFDLVYVFAIGPLSHHLVEHVDARTAAETVILALAIFYAWYMVAWGTNWLDPDPVPVRLALVGLMFASLLMSVAIGDAFGDRAWLFVTGYLILQVGRCAFLILALRGRPQGEHFVNNLGVGDGRRCSVGGRRDRPRRHGLPLWTVAILIAYAGDWVQHWLPCRGRRVDLEHTEIAGGHLVERFRLFFIIVLGEIVLTTGTAFAGEPFELERLLALAIAFAGTVALWWCYFQRAEPLGARAARSAEDAGAVGLWATWTLTLIVLAMVGIVVADEMAVAHPGDDVTVGFTVLAFGGPAVFLLAELLFQYATHGKALRSRALGAAALAILAVPAAQSTLIVGIALSSAVLIAVAIGDTVQGGAQEPSEPP